MRETKRLIASEFEAVKNLLKMTEARIEIARLRLVDGRKLQEIADEYNCSRQSVGDAVNVVWKKVLDYRAAQQTEIHTNSEAVIPEGWEQITIIAPSFLVAKLKLEIAEYSSWNGK